MTPMDFLFGRSRPERARAQLPVLDKPPHNVAWRTAHPRGAGGAVSAALARRSGVLKTKWGRMRYYARKHYIVDYGDNDRAVVRRDIFERTYKRRPDGQYEKRTDVVLRYFVLDRPSLVRTLEGLERAAPGDWVVEGVLGELYPVSPERARAAYEPAHTLQEAAV